MILDEPSARQSFYANLSERDRLNFRQSQESDFWKIISLVWRHPVFGNLLVLTNLHLWRKFSLLSWLRNVQSCWNYLGFLKMGHSRPLFLYFRLFKTHVTVNKCSIYINFCRWLDSNRGSLVSEATALPTEPQPLPTFYLKDNSDLCYNNVRNV